MDTTNNEMQEFPLVDAQDNEILMHRDVHFGGKFDFMLDYYRKEGKGARDEFSPERILYLAGLERQIKQNLAPLLLSGPEAERIAEAKEAYKKLSDIYDVPVQKQKYPKLIAD